MILGITGGTGCGKTTLLNLIADLGGTVLDCDAIYHQLLQTNASLLGRIAQRFPAAVTGGILDRKELGKTVFADKNALLDLNRITHGAVKAEVLQQLSKKPPLAAIDAIGLFEGGLAPLCNVTVAVTAPEDARIRRLMLRDGICAEYAESRIRAQHTDSWFREKCDHVLVNDSTPEVFRAKCLAFLHTLGIMKENQ